MAYFVFKNRRNGRYISGTDFRTSPHQQILSNKDRPPKLFLECQLKGEMLYRGISEKTYKIVMVEVKEIT